VDDAALADDGETDKFRTLHALAAAKKIQHRLNAPKVASPLATWTNKVKAADNPAAALSALAKAGAPPGASAALKAGYKFKYETIDEAFQNILR